MKKIFLIIGIISLALKGVAQEGYIGIGLGGALPLGGYGGFETDEGDYKDVGFAEHGYAMKFIDVQYKFYKNIGASYSWWMHNHSLDENAYTNEYIKLTKLNGDPYNTLHFDTETDDDYWSFSTHTIGLFLSTSGKPQKFNSSNFDFNIKASVAITPGVRIPELNITWADITADNDSIDPKPKGGSRNTRSATSNSSTGLSLGVGGKYYINDHWAISGGVDYFALKIEVPSRRIKIVHDTGNEYPDPTEKLKDFKIRFVSLYFGLGYVW